MDVLKGTLIAYSSYMLDSVTELYFPHRRCLNVRNKKCPSCLDRGYHICEGWQFFQVSTNYARPPLIYTHIHLTEALYTRSTDKTNRCPYPTIKLFFQVRFYCLTGYKLQKRLLEIKIFFEKCSIWFGCSRRWLLPEKSGFPRAYDILT